MKSFLLFLLVISAAACLQPAAAASHSKRSLRALNSCRAWRDSCKGVDYCQRNYLDPECCCVYPGNPTQSLVCTSPRGAPTCVRLNYMAAASP
mmetsp:Transcript_11402/g.18574  ORF Transcript_11402/g.18574 Transcript_11402/m.18574 type:complete len:93 (+) Transcript_11402:403-681(+)